MRISAVTPVVSAIAMFVVLALGARSVLLGSETPASGQSAVQVPGCPIASSQAAEPDVPALASLGEEATGRAERSAGQVDLRQVDHNWDTGIFVFRYTDHSLSRELSFQFTPDAATQWQVGPSADGQLLDSAIPAFDLEALRVGPQAAVDAIESHYPGIDVWAMTLFVEGCDLVWHVFGDVEDGAISARVRNSTGELEELQPAPMQRPREFRPR